MQFDWPVGDEHERQEHWKFPGWWEPATLYCQRYDATGKMAIHTGLDLNLNRDETGRRHFDMDAHAPVYASADGLVAFAGKLPVWGTVIVVKHVDDQAVVYTRYAHVEQLRVSQGQIVQRGEQLAQVGNADGRYPYHLHFDIARIDLGAHPGDWPGDDIQRVRRDYHDTFYFLRNQLAIAPGAQPTKLRITGSPTVRVRAEPSAQAAILNRVRYGEVVGALEIRDGWARIEQPCAGWIVLTWTQAVEE